MSDFYLFPVHLTREESLESNYKQEVTQTEGNKENVSVTILESNSRLSS